MKKLKQNTFCTGRIFDKSSGQERRQMEDKRKLISQSDNFRQKSIFRQKINNKNWYVEFPTDN